ncbi:MAG TPA: hypothetical protein VD788_07755, partial [Candidatus Polarisedimenticolaceae bacterium]|nr:hypothetical protein [Candidatus Polarisedimenticolaceae bacterium]
MVEHPETGLDDPDEPRQPDASAAIDAMLAARTRELHLIQLLGRRAAEAKSVDDLFRAAISIVQEAAGLDLALVAFEHGGRRDLTCHLSRPCAGPAVERLSRLAGTVLGWPADDRLPTAVEVLAEEFDEGRGVRTGFAADDPIVVPVMRRARPVAIMVFLPAGSPSEAGIRLLFSATNQLAVHLDRILTAREEEVDRFRSILDAMLQPVVLTDAGLGIVHLNASGRALLDRLGLEGAHGFDAVVERLGIAAEVGRVLERGEAWTDGEARLA